MFKESRFIYKEDGGELVPEAISDESDMVCDSSDTYSAHKADKKLGLSEAEDLLTQLPDPGKEILSILKNLDREEPGEKDDSPVKTFLAKALKAYLTEPFRKRLQATTVYPNISDEDRNDQLKTDLSWIEAIEVAVDLYVSQTDSVKMLRMDLRGATDLNSIRRSIFMPIWELIPSPIKAVNVGKNIGERLAGAKDENDIGWFGDNELNNVFNLLWDCEKDLDSFLARDPAKVAIDRSKDPNDTRNLRALLEVLNNTKSKIGSIDNTVATSKMAKAGIDFLIRLLVRVKDDKEFAYLRGKIYPLIRYTAHIPHLVAQTSKTLEIKHGEKVALNVEDILDTILPVDIKGVEKVPEFFKERRANLEIRLKKVAPEPYYSVMQLVLNRMERLLTEENETYAFDATMRVSVSLTGMSGVDHDTAETMVKYLANLADKEETMVAEAMIFEDEEHMAPLAKEILFKEILGIDVASVGNFPLFKMFTKPARVTQNGPSADSKIL